MGRCPRVPLGDAPTAPSSWNRRLPDIDGQTCEAPDCLEPATHTVTLAIPGEPETTTLVCRLHDRSLKTYTVRSRQKKPAEPPVEVPNVVRCGGERHLLDEPSNLDPTQRQPCPQCGSTSRFVETYLNDSVSFHSQVETSLQPGGGKWTVKSKGGDDYTRDLEAWGKRGLHRDRAADRYVETIELWDGTRIVSTARLSTWAWSLSSLIGTPHQKRTTTCSASPAPGVVGRRHPTN